MKKEVLEFTARIQIIYDERYGKAARRDAFAEARTLARDGGSIGGVGQYGGVQVKFLPPRFKKGAKSHD